jgi:hypothetical protein
MGMTVSKSTIINVMKDIAAEKVGKPEPTIGQAKGGHQESRKEHILC